SLRKWFAALGRTFPTDLAIEPLEITDEHTRGRIVVDERHLHPGKLVHGGVWVGLGDTVAAWETFRHLPPGYNFTTIELKLNAFAAGRAGDELLATARHLHEGRSTHVIEVAMERDDGKLAATLIVTQFILPPPDQA
ncbi:MAG: 1,4-dihydroxy-2-naphthoyl-CoA hydrolase, partial [Solirubrobacterales bacterium]|nr:1,4-dihydroxy-2-naphthoyl-CoA hydrolase [Solirubrobacterales bacterium]